MNLYITPQARLARDWWRELAAKADGRPANSSVLARLRRVRSPLEAMMHTEVIDLIMRIAPSASSSSQERVAGLAAVLAHVREDDPSRSVAGRLGGRDPDERLMKPARFRKLMLAAPGEERLTTFRRALRLLAPVANVADLSTGWLLWDHPDTGDRIRADWMFRYVGANDEDVRSVAELDSPTPSRIAIEESTQ